MGRLHLVPMEASTDFGSQEEVQACRLRFGVPRYGLAVIGGSGEVVEVLLHIGRTEWVGRHGRHCDLEESS